MTTDRATLLGLADMVEAASRPDRELDAEIARSCGWVALDKHQWWSAEHVADCRQRKVSKWKYATQSLPTFTASLDAALSLVPEGAGVEVQRYWTSEHDDAVWSAVAIVGMGAVEESRDRPSAALALTAAALRALAQEAPSDER